MPAKVEPCAWFPTHRQHGLTGLTAEQVAGRIGFPPNQRDDPEKVVHSWTFTVNGQQCAVWDYKGSHKYKMFSAYGPADALRLVFGEALT